MRGPSHTKQALTESLSGRGALVAVGAVAIVCVLAAVWLLFGRPGSSTASLDAPSAERLATFAPPIADGSEGSTRSSVGAAEPDEVIVVPPVAQLANHTHRFSGHFVFEDGSIPPAMRFAMETYPPGDTTQRAQEAQSISPCLPAVESETDDRARFAVDGLCPGTYTIRPQLNALPPVEATVHVPNTGARVVLSGYLLHVRMRTPDGSPAARSSIQIKFPRPPNEDGLPRTGTSHAMLNAEGERWFGVPMAGTCTVIPAEDATLSQTLELSGPSRVVDVLIELRPQSRGAVLRVDLRSCAAPAAEVQDYCIALYDPATGAFVDQICSTDDRPWQTFPDLKPGRFLARAQGKYFGRPVFYRLASKEKDVPVELVDGRETTLRMCVDLGGRLSVLVNDAQATTGPQPGVETQVEVQREGDASSTTLSFRAPHGDGLKVGDKLPMGTGLLTDNVLEPGSYTMTVRAAGYGAASQSVAVHPSETTRVVVHLQKQ